MPLNTVYCVVRRNACVYLQHKTKPEDSYLCRETGTGWEYLFENGRNQRWVELPDYYNSLFVLDEPTVVRPKRFAVSKPSRFNKVKLV
jgi:hypothetical protein